jgi:hypothetical protein
MGMVIAARFLVSISSIAPTFGAVAALDVASEAVALSV